MKNYEFTYLISSELPEQDQKDFQSKIISFIQESGGTLNNIANPIFKKLCYPIKKKTFAFLNVLDFYLDPKNLKNFEKKIKKENQTLLRYLILEKEVLKIPTKISKELLFSQERVQKPKIKVEIKEFEKKLEEILSED